MKLLDLFFYECFLDRSMLFHWLLVLISLGARERLQFGGISIINKPKGKLFLTMSGICYRERGFCIYYRIFVGDPLDSSLLV